MNRPNELFSLKFVVGQYHTLFGKDITLAEVINTSRVVLKSIGNLNTQRFSARGKITNFNFSLLCKAYLIKSVTTDSSYSNDTLIGAGISSSSFYSHYPNENVYFNSEGMEADINIFDHYGRYVRRVEFGSDEWAILNAERHNKILITEYNNNVVGKPRGTYINFENLGDGLLKFDVNNINIEVIYDKLIVDEEGLWKISEKEITAICYFLNFIDIQKKYYQKLVDANMLGVARADSDRAIGNARVGERVTDNDRDMIFEQALTANRKQVGLPYR